MAVGAHHSSVRAHDLALWLLGSALIIACLTFRRLVEEAQQPSAHKDPVTLLRVIDAVAVIALAFASVLLPRRPDVFINGRQVDRQSTVSALNKYTWSWVGPLLHFAAKKNDLDVDDVPKPDRRLRADGLKQDWDALEYKGSLLRSLIWAYKGSIAFQWGLTICRAFFAILPFRFMLQLIKILEERETGSGPTLQLWGLVLWMAIFNLIDAVSLLLR